MTPDEVNYLKRQLGLSGGSPKQQRKIANAKRPATWAPKPARRRKPEPLGKQARRWWKQHAPAWLGGKARPQRRRQRRKAKRAGKGHEFGPVVQAFLGGQSVRQAVYLHGASDPAVMVVSAWPDQVAAGEAAIRASLLLALDELAQARAQLEQGA